MQGLMLRFWFPLTLILGVQAISKSNEISSSAGTAYTSKPTRSTCPSIDINYITHTLPQKCLWTTASALSLASLGSGRVPDGEPSPSISAESTTSQDTSVSTQASESFRESLKASWAQTDVPAASITPTSQPQSTSSQLKDDRTQTTQPDTDSPLDNANFLSFEEWKKQNLAKQVVENVLQRTLPTEQPQGTVKADFENALESMADEGEIDIDLTGFGGVNKPVEAHRLPDAKVESLSESGAGATVMMPTASHSLPKDAGKTSKERSNYASFDCGATAVKSNAECKSVTAVLKENKDNYMLNPCSANNKFFIVELCDEIKIDTVVLANFEFFSSMFRTFRLSVSRKYPVKIDKWVAVGTYEARNSREIQAFLVESDAAWARWLRIEFLSHYGSEYYCPLSLLRVHGMTAIEEYRREEAANLNAEPEDDDIEELAEVVEVPKDSAIAPLKSTSSSETAEPTRPTQRKHELIVLSESSAPSKRNITGNRAMHPDSISTSLAQRPWSFEANTTSHMMASEKRLQCPANHTSILLPPSGTVYIQSQSVNSTAPDPSSTSPETSSIASKSPPQISDSSSASITSSEIKYSTSIIDNPSTIVGPGASTDPSSLSSTSSTKYSQLVTASTVHPKPSFTMAATKPSSSPPPQPAPNSPPTQDSFFKSTNKRLQSLELSSTLSLQYIESQSRQLRDAFNAVSARQLERTSDFLAALNATVSRELATFRAQYDQLWQGTVLELAAQKEEREREVRVLGEQMELLAAELGSQRRVGIAQSVLLVLCLGLVMFSRAWGSEVTLARNVQSLMRGSSRRTPERGGGVGGGAFSWESPFASPPRSRQGLWGTDEDEKQTPVRRTQVELEREHHEFELETPERPQRAEVLLDGMAFDDMDADRPSSALATPSLDHMHIGDTGTPATSVAVGVAATAQEMAIEEEDERIDVE